MSVARTVNLAQNLMVSTLAVGAEFGRATALCERGVLQGGLNLQSGFNGDANADTQGLNLKRKESYGESKNVKFSRSGEIEQILLSEQATACFTFLDDSQFLAFAERMADKMQLVKVLRLAGMSLKTVDGLQRVVEFFVRELFGDEIKG